MADLFHYGSAAKALDADDRYGSDGDMKKTQYVMQLLGFPGDVDTLKCLLTAAEKRYRSRKWRFRYDKR